MKKYILPAIYILISILAVSCEEELSLNPPLEISTINVLNIQFYSVSLSWSIYEGDDFERYEIYLKKSSETGFKLYTNINDAMHVFLTINGLNSYTDYTIFVRVLNLNGEYADSKYINVKTQDDYVSKINIVKINEVTYEAMRIYWTRYQDEARVKYLKYEIYYSKEPGFIPSAQNLFYAFKSVNDTSIQISNLDAKTNYYFIVRVYNITGKYAESPIVFAKTKMKPPVVYLSSPYEITETSAKLKWSKATSEDFSRYEIHLSKTMDFTPDYSTRLTEITNIETTGYELTNLIKFNDYFVKILVYVADSGYSVSGGWGFTATTGGGPVPVQFLEPEVYPAQIFLSWTQSPSNYFLSYELHKDTIPNFIPTQFNAVVNIENIQTTGFNLKGLKKNTAYYFKIEVYNKMGRSSVSDEIKITTLP